jgi:putative endonuclease
MPAADITEGRIDRRARGAQVEAAARRYLVDAGLRELAANASYRGGELDLVMLDPGVPDRGARTGGTVVFVEVRYRSHASFGGGTSSVDMHKRRKLVHAAQHFLAEHREFAREACRFDVVEADGDPAAPRLTWLRDAFRADDP